MSHAPFDKGAGRGSTSRPPQRSAPWGLIGAVLGLLGLAAGVGAWLRPMPTPEPVAAPVYSEQQVAEAKAAVCEAYEKADRALQATGRKKGATDPAEILAVAVNIRLALSESSSWLRQALLDNPATPPKLADDVQKSASSLQGITIDQLGEASREELDAVYGKADEADAAIHEACK